MPDVVNPLSPPPRSVTDRVLLSWLDTLYRRLTQRGGLLWTQTDKEGSSLADLSARPWDAVEDTPTTLGGYGVTDELATGTGLSGGGVLADGLTLELKPAAAAEIGGVLKAPASADVGASVPDSTVAVTSPSAPAPSATYIQAEAQATATLANEIKGDVGALVTDHNALVSAHNALAAKHNELLSRLRAAGILEV